MASIKEKLEFVSTAGWDKHRMIDALISFADNPSATNYVKLAGLMLAYQDDHNDTLGTIEKLNSLGDL